MGQYLTTSLLTRFSITKSDLESFPINNIKQIQNKFINTEDDLFSIEETESNIIFRVKDNILLNELVVFLKVFYKDLHGTDAECQEIISTLDNDHDVQKWLTLANNKSFEKFQTDNFGYSILYDGWKKLRINHSSIMLVLEGKIMMETYGKQFSFFEKLIRKTYSDFNISKLIKVGISE
jgi:hypothetical protein